MIETFPVFSPLSLSLRDEINQLTSRFEPYSDFNFTSLFCWNTDGGAGVSRINENLVIRLADYVTGETIYSLLGDSSIDESLALLLSATPELKLVPEVVASQVINDGRFYILEDRNNFDYVYSLDKIAALKGNSYKKKRNKLNAAMKELGGDWSLETHCHLSDDKKNLLITLFQAWSGNSRQTDEEIKAEAEAIRRLLDNAGSFNLLFTLLNIKGRLVGFSISELLGNAYALTHFEKALPIHENSYLLLINGAAAHLLENTCNYINWEQDLGIEGLRKSKMSYAPDKFLKKYTVSLR